MRRPPLVTRLLDDTLVVGLVILAVGAVVLLVTSRAQNGYPWQEHLRVTVAVPDAGKLTKNADVRIGGARVGQVLSIDAVPARGAEPAHAELQVELEGDAGPLPVDTTAEVRLSSVLGGKFVSLVPGRSERTVPDGGRLALRNAATSVDVDEAFRVFDAAGRRGVRTVVHELGTALAGRGGAINETLATTVGMLPRAERVLATLNAAPTDLPGFLEGAAAATAAVRPVAGELASLTGGAGATLAALDDAGPALGDSIAALPGTADRTREALGTLRPVLDDAAAIAEDLRPAATTLRPASERLSETVRIATRVTPELATLDRPLARTFRAVRTFTTNPESAGALRLLGGTDLATFGSSAFVGLGAILNTASEAEQHCRVVTDWITGLSEMLSEGDAGGNWLRMIPVFERDEMFPSAGPAEGLHANPYPRQDATECEAGNEPYTPGTQIGNPAGRQGAPE
jgi:phospholipid/cholesterol/gamma-HCH transport system substrate-binding protein